MTKTLAVVGSRDYPSMGVAVDYLERIRCQCEFRYQLRIVSGGAAGPDTWAANYAKNHGLKLIVHEADWNAHGKAAGPIRNSLIVADADALLAFHDGKSKGTLDSIGKAEAKGIPVWVVNTHGDCRKILTQKGGSQ